jgi:hypothetical protein
LASASSSHKREKFSSKSARVLNSAMSFAIAYILIMFMFAIATALMGKLFGFDSYISLTGVKFEIGRHKYDAWNVFLIWSFGTFTTALIGIFCSYIFYQLREKLYLGNMVFLWGAVISYSIIAAQGILPCIQPGDYYSPYYSNLSVVFAWLSVPIPLLYIISLAFIAFLVFFSIYTSKPFLSFSYSFSKVNKTDRKRKYFFETVFVPYIAAAFILLSYFHITYQSMSFFYVNLVYILCIGLSIIVSFLVININDMKVEEVLRYKNLQKLSPALFIVFMVILLFFVVIKQGFYLPF